LSALNDLDAKEIRVEGLSFPATWKRSKQV
jgi:hypothetical protein